MYEDNVSLEEKIRSVPQKIYRADDIVIDKSVIDQLKDGFVEKLY
jgi:formyltetrahydrofolate synthetase